MKLVGILLAIFGWLLPLIGLTVATSTGARMFLCLLGIGVALGGILKVLNDAHQKEAIWRR
jgi:predicted phage tail protein